MYSTIGSMRKNTESLNTPVNVKNIVGIYQPVNFNSTKKTIIKQEYEPMSTKVWGRPLWFSIHHGALYYPKKPDLATRQNMVNFIIGLPTIIPCMECKVHATTYINKRKSFLSKAVLNQESLFIFFWMFHNDVNTRTGKPTLTLEETYRIYRNNPQEAL